MVQQENLGINGTEVDDDSETGFVMEDKPEVSLEWSDIQVTFKVLSDAAGNDDSPAYAIYPEVDPAAPSSKTLYAQRKRLIRSQKDKNPMTLSNLIGNSAVLGSVPASNSTNGHDFASDDQEGSVGPGEGSQSDTPLKKCHICGRGFNKTTYLKRHILSHSSVKPYKCNICNWGKNDWSSPLR